MPSLSISSVTPLRVPIFFRLWMMLPGATR
jgi:hypothetical protein